MSIGTGELRSGRGIAGTLGAIVRHPSLPAFVGVIVVWLATGALAGRGLYGTLAAGVLAASFLVIAGIGQLFVITVGNGGIDLSVPYVMTLAGFLSCQIMAGTDANLVTGLLVGVGGGVLCGLLSAILIEVVGMPPLVGTLAVGFGIQTFTLQFSGSVVGVTSPALQSFTTLRWGPIPVFGLLGIVITVLFIVILKRTSFGRRVEAVGQSPTAARLAGTNPRLIRAGAFVISGAMAGLAGVLLAANSGGPSLSLGTPYQLASIAVVVLGGSLISGGRAMPGGVWAGAVLLSLLGTLVSVAKLSAGLQDVVQGALIILVLSLTRVPGARR
jgi:ribose transport system permease protein